MLYLCLISCFVVYFCYLALFPFGGRPQERQSRRRFDQYRTKDIASFTAVKLTMPFEVEWFGVGGMTASQPCPNLIFKMARYSPDIVVVCLGGNDISSGAEPSTVIDCLTSLFHRIRDFAPRQPDIFFTEIVSRGKFRSSLQREEFDGKRRTVNNKMKKILGRTFIRIDVRFPRHYLPDGIHFNDAGTVIFLLSISKTVKSRSFE